MVDDTAGTIRLPCVVNAQGLVDLALIGGIKSESLPNITGEIGLNTGSRVSGSFATMTRGSSFNLNGTSVTNTEGISFDASRSSSAYKNNAPVQQEAIQYPYYIQVATGIEETLPAIREYKTNVPYVLGDSRYFEANPYNASWLESNGQYNSATVYPDMWSQLQVELNSSLVKGDTIEISGKTYVKRWLPVVLSTGTITDEDFVVNTADQTFRLPLRNGCENIPDWNNAQNISTNVPFTAPCDGWIYGAGQVVGADAAYILNGIQIGVARGSSAWQSNGTVAVRVKKGDVFSSNANFSYGLHFIPAIGNGSLYYYVGDTVQDASLINAGAVLGQLSNKADINASNFNADGKSLLSGLGMPSGRYIDLTLGASGSTYTAPANGYFIMSGVATSANAFVYFVGSGMNPRFYAPGTGGTAAGFIPLKKGKACRIDYANINISANTTTFRFAYAEGEE